MSLRNSYVFVGGTIGCLVLLFCAGLIALIGVGLTSQYAIFPRAIDRIAYMDNELNIQVMDGRGEHRVALTKDASNNNDLAYMFPTWSPNSQRVAYIRISGTRNAFEGTLYSAPAEGGEATTVYKSNAAVPFYVYWSPDSRQISFLAQGNNEMALMLGQSDGKEEARKIESGSPLYWAWSPDNQTMLTHVGGSQHDSRSARMGLLQSQGENKSQTLSQGPAAFQAPQFSPEGSAILYAGTGPSHQDALYVADAQGGNPQLVANYQGRVAFSWSPDGKKIAWLTTPLDAELPNLGPISVSDRDGKNVQTLGTDDALAFFWSPDSQHIAYLSLLPPGSQGCNENCSRVPGLASPLEQGRNLQMRWRIADVASKTVRTLVAFTPTANFISVLPYFDQYARSVTFWSPDSQHFVYTQRERQGQGSVWVIDRAENSGPQKIAEGTLAVWSWK